jgi:phosphatidylserine decarboxylase
MRWSVCGGLGSLSRKADRPLQTIERGPRTKFIEDVCGLIIESHMVRDGFFYALGLGAVAALLWYLKMPSTLLALPIVLAAFFLWFFRDPSRTIPQGAGEIVSPADGIVTEAEWIETVNGSRLRLSIFLNVFDVHVNRSPVAGTVKLVEFREGQFMNAMKPESVLNNEQTLIVVDAGRYDVSFKQIAGLLARRIVCNVKAGDRVERGQRIGLIKFGSRVDVLMPAEANLKVKTGSRVRGGSSVLAVVPEPGASPAKAVAA